jgi:hypothetical protein
MSSAERVRLIDLHPCIDDKLSETPVDHNYMLQDTWAARKVFESVPDLHVDIGSTALLVGILAQFTRVCSIDIRPLQVHLPGLEVRAGSILQMPFPDRSVKSISSLCVVEHIGLGRYGDPLNPHGTQEAAGELQRIVAPGGNLYVSVPIEPVPKVYFNAHRSFTSTEFIAYFPELELIETRLIQRGNVYTAQQDGEIDYDRGMVVGLFHLRRPFESRGE